jgi:uncharacterized membrane protein
MSNANRLFLNLLFFLQILLVFLLVFENSIRLPLWLQVAGRLHPAVVHLPIGFVMAYLLLYLFRKQVKKKSYQKISFFVLMLTSLSAVVAAIFGLFLSRQGDYESLALHKWSAVVFNFICYGAVILTQLNLLHAALAVVAFVVMLAQVLVVGHSGGDLTHGKGYVFAPLHQDDPKDNASLSAYAQVVLPIFEKKCFSCHNEAKAKGKLIMTSAEKFLQGGKHGAALVAGDAKKSRLIQHILLPLSHDDHMPPEGKPQLNELETKILAAWINAGASFEKKLADLAPTDSLRLLASKIKPAEVSATAPSFEAASPSVIEKLNTPFRVIFPLHKNRPALRADFFISEMYKPSALEELSQIKTQLTELNLSKMPVEDQQLETIAGFANLEKLNLNFTLVSGAKLEVLNGLKNLKSLSLAGTKVSTEQLQKLSIPSLQEVFIWNTSITADQLKELQSRWKNIRIVSTEFRDDRMLKLSLPSSSKKDVLKKEEQIELKHAMKGVTIRYTTDGTPPDSVTGNVYEGPFAIGHTAQLKAIACKSGWYCSPVFESILFVEGVKPASAQLLTQPDKTYTAAGAATLTDGKLGLADQYKEPLWLGYRDVPMQAVFSFTRAQAIKLIALSYAKNVGAYVFPPARVEVYGGDGKNFQLLQTILPALPASYSDGTKKEVVFIHLPEKSFQFYKLIVTPVSKLPAWHSGKGDKGWVFADEVFFY